MNVCFDGQQIQLQLHFQLQFQLQLQLQIQLQCNDDHERPKFINFAQIFQMFNFSLIVTGILGKNMTKAVGVWFTLKKFAWFNCSVH